VQVFRKKIGFRADALPFYNSSLLVIFGTPALNCCIEQKGKLESLFLGYWQLKTINFLLFVFKSKKSALKDD
jgi:hypothetical protein